MHMNLRLGTFDLVSVGLCIVGAAGCSSTTSESDEGTGSEVATSVVSGVLNSGADSRVGFNELQRSPRRRGLDWFLDELNPVGTARAADWSCTARSLEPTFAGPGTYTFTPGDCTITGPAGKTVSADWSSTFQLDYGSACDSTHRAILNQVAQCSLTRTTDANGNVRTFVGPEGNSYSITHDTHGQGTGWDSSVSPAPSNSGASLTCGSSGCATGLTLVINGSHLLGSLSRAGGTAIKVWDHTVSTGTGGITVSRSGASMVASGSVTVQHNRAKFTSTTSFDHVAYGDASCCFPTGGSVTTTFSSGPHAGKTETLTFGASAVCGEATLTRPDGSTAGFTLSHCI